MAQPKANRTFQSLVCAASRYVRPRDGLVTRKSRYVRPRDGLVTRKSRYVRPRDGRNNASTMLQNLRFTMILRILRTSRAAHASTQLIFIFAHELRFSNHFASPVNIWSCSCEHSCDLYICFWYYVSQWLCSSDCNDNTMTMQWQCNDNTIQCCWRSQCNAMTIQYNDNTMAMQWQYNTMLLTQPMQCNFSTQSLLHMQ